MKTYNFISAVNSCKRFKPVGCEYYFHYLSDWLDYGRVNPEFINSKFEIEEKTITITESEFNEAWKENSFRDYRQTRDKIKKALGF